MCGDLERGSGVATAAGVQGTYFRSSWCLDCFAKRLRT